jgi:hypothetical protein
VVEWILACALGSHVWHAIVTERNSNVNRQEYHYNIFLTMFRYCFTLQACFQPACGV